VPIADGDADPRGEPLVAAVGVTVTLRGNTYEQHTVRSPWRRDAEALDPAVLLFTSGTTGEPVGVLHSHRSLIWAVWNTASVGDEVLYGAAAVPSSDQDLMENLIQRSRSRVLPLTFFSAMPIYTIAALSIVHRALLLGDTLVVGGDGSLDAVSSALRASQVTNLGLTPHLALRLARQDSGESLWGAGLLSVGVGGGTVSPEAVVDLEARTGCPVSVGYGATELGGVAAMARPNEALEIRASTVGRPLASVEFELRGPGQAREGRLFCRTRSGMEGVVENGVFRPRVSEWIDTGDWATLDEHEVYRIRGRADHLIIRGGQRIDPTAVEALLERHPQVWRAAVVAVESRVPADVNLVALVVPSGPGVDPISLRSELSNTVPRDLLPRRIGLVGDLPMTADGAIRRHLLRALVPPIA